MHAALPSSLDSTALSRRLGELAGHERAVQVEFLIHLDEFDRRRAWLEAGYGSLWDYCLRVLHLREGAAGRRIAAMRVLRRLPGLAAALRDGRLCLSTLALLGPVLTEESADDLVARAAFLPKADVERLLVSLQPRSAPKDGLRRLPDRRVDPNTAGLPLAPRPAETCTSRAPPVAPAGVGCGPHAEGAEGLGANESTVDGPGVATPVPPAPAPADAVAPPADAVAPPADAVAPPADAVAPPADAVARPDELSLPPVPASRPTVRPVAADTYSLRVTVDAAFKEDLDELRALLSHKVPDGDLAAVLREALRCAIDKHGRRKGAVEPARKKATAVSRPPDGGWPGMFRGEQLRDTRVAVPADVRRQVWKRDGGKCAWRGPGGHRCTSRWKLEVDHIDPAALGGPPSVDNLRLLCRAHNTLHAEQIFGREHMARFRRGATRMGETTISGDSGGAHHVETGGRPECDAAGRARG
jgi:hypothetical protein